MTLPERVGHYRIVEILGRGARGVLYRAVDEGLGRAVALKVLSAAAVADAEAWAGFRREAERATRLRHPNIAALYELGEHDEIPFLAFELLEGIDLRRALASGVRPHLTAAIPVLLQVLAGLDHAHEHRFLHRDLDASRIFLPRGQQAKILGFGVAGLDEPVGARNDSRHDLSAVGLVLHELVTGRPAGSAGADLARVPTGREWGRLREVLRRALAADPGGGYGDATSMAGDLAAALVDLGGSSHWTTPVDPSLFPEHAATPTGEMPSPEPTDRATGRGRWPIAAAAATVAFLALLVFGWSRFRDRAPPIPAPATPLPVVSAGPPAATTAPIPTSAPVKPAPTQAPVAGSVARANEHLENRRYPQALAEARAVLRREPGNSEAQEISEEAQAALVIDDSLQKARAALKRGDKAAAQEALKKGLALNENEARLKLLWRQATE